MIYHETKKPKKPNQRKFRLDFEPNYYDVTVEYINHHVMEISPYLSIYEYICIYICLHIYTYMCVWLNFKDTFCLYNFNKILSCFLISVLWAKNLQVTLIFDSIHRGKMEQILLAYGMPKETVAAISILYRNTKVKVRSPDGDTEYFDIVAGVLQGTTLAPYLFIICLDYVLRTSIDKIRENDFELTKKRSRRYPAKLPTPTTPTT